MTEFLILIAMIAGGFAVYKFATRKAKSGDGKGGRPGDRPRPF